MEKSINRIAILLIPKEPCSEWLRMQLGEFYKTDICKVFLLDFIDDDFKIDQLPGLIKKYYERMFVELLDSYGSKKSWPEVTYETFENWFEIKHDAFVNDFGEAPIRSLDGD
jgi:hypothetical protein